MNSIHFNFEISKQVMFGVSLFGGSDGKGFTVSLLCFDFTWWIYFDEQYCYED